MDKYNKPIQSMVEALNKNLLSSNKGFPVAAVLMDEKWCDLITNVNSKAKTKETDYRNHAEFKCYEELMNKENNVNTKNIIIITIPPCNNCLKNISNPNIELEIYYLFDDVRRKIEKSYLKQFIEANKGMIKKINPSSFRQKSLKFEVYYIIMFYLKGCLSQQANGISTKEIEAIAIKWLTILKKVINSSNPSKGQINIDSVWSMIQKTKKINIENVKHISNRNKEIQEWWVV